MFDVPVDSAYSWLGLAAASVVGLGTVLAFPTATPPDAVAVADTIDRVSVGPTGASATRELAAESIKVGRERVRLRNGARTAGARVAYGPITPAAGNWRLRAVLDGAHPGTYFPSRAAFANATAAARERDPEWRTAPSELTVRRVRWEGVDVTLVG